MSTRWVPKSAKRRVLVFATALSLGSALYFLFYTDRPERVAPPTFSWVGYTQRSDGFYGSVVISNRNSFPIHVDPKDADREAILEAFASGKPYLPPVNEALFPCAVVEGRTNIVYWFPEPDSQSVTQVIFIWEVWVRETALKSYRRRLWSAAKMILPEQSSEGVYSENPNEGTYVLDIPRPPHATNSGSVLRGVRERVMF